MFREIAKKFRYAFDNAMSRGLFPLIGLLSLITLSFIFTVTAIVILLGIHPNGERLPWGEIAWRSLLRTLDAGTMATDSGIGYRIAMLMVTLFGVVLVAGLIGIISNSLSERIQNLRKGRSLVLENHHTVILGWNSKAVQIISELVIANASHKRDAVVLLSDRDKVLVEEEIHRKIKPIGNTRIVVRSGDPMSRTDLRITAIEKARSIIVLSPDGTSDADSFSIKTVLAVRNLESGLAPGCSFIAEIRHKDNFEAAQLVGAEDVQWVMGEDLINRLIAQSCRQGGLSGAITDILDFSGSEIYICQPILEEITYRDANLSLQGAVAMGIIRQGEVHLNPVPDALIHPEDKLIVLAEDDSSIAIGELQKANPTAINVKHSEARSVERTLILGSNSGVELLLSELDRGTLPGSLVTLISQNLNLARTKYNNFELELLLEDSTSRRVLEKVQPESYNHIIILASRENSDIQAADARTLLSLLHVRAMTEGSAVNIVTEILDDHNREIVETNRVDDFIVSDKIVSHAIAQLSENNALHPVFESLWSSSGPSLRLMPAENYVNLGQKIDFTTVIAAAQILGESAVGYRSVALRSEPGELHGVRLNPRRDSELTFQEGDSILVVSNH